MSLPLAIFDLGPANMLMVSILAVLLFGERLPEVGRKFGKKFVEFKKGLQAIEGEFQAISRSITAPSSSSSSTPSSSSPSSAAPPARNVLADYAEATAPKFEPPAALPAESGGESAGG